jgi:Tetracyclin repressor-like, C-terminal domain
VLDAEEEMYRALRASGLSPEQIYGVRNLIAWHIQGIARTAMQDQEITRRTGVTNEAYWESRNSFWVTYFEPERFPTMSWIHEHGGFDGPEPADAFAFERVLDGIQTLVDRR